MFVQHILNPPRSTDVGSDELEDQEEPRNRQQPCEGPEGEPAKKKEKTISVRPPREQRRLFAQVEDELQTHQYSYSE